MDTESGQLKRRDFLKIGAFTGTALLAATAVPRVSFAGARRATLEQIMKMTPQVMAQRSAAVQKSLQYLQWAAASINRRNIQIMALTILDNPAPTFAQRLQDASVKQTVFNDLTAQGYLAVPIAQFLPPFSDPRKSVQPFYSAPGSGYQGHHSYPGGVVTHTAMNVKSVLALYDNYKDTNGALLNRDMVVASELLHDLHKPWVFQWNPAGDTRAEVTIAGTGEHHIYSIAESIHRGIPAAFCVAQACAHDHPGTPTDEAQVVNWIKAACILLGVDPVAKGLLSPAGDTVPVPRLIENFICHLGDHDSVVSVPAAQSIIAEIQTIATEEYGMTQSDLESSKFYAFRNYVFSQATIMYLYSLLCSRGRDALVAKVTSIVTQA